MAYLAFQTLTVVVIWKVRYFLILALSRPPAGQLFLIILLLFL